MKLLTTTKNMIKIIKGEENKNTLSFLDILISRENNDELEMQIYQKNHQPTLTKCSITKVRIQSPTRGAL